MVVYFPSLQVLLFQTISDCDKKDKIIFIKKRYLESDLLPGRNPIALPKLASKKILPTSFLILSVIKITRITETRRGQARVRKTLGQKPRTVFQQIGISKTGNRRENKAINLPMFCSKMDQDATFCIQYSWK